ncbi:MAG: GspE/PulE family protein [Candidatus Colwellbacteria bacterium]|nr:GspE/PulE family protein [Candidatus Colwellbacteria bacterium]
MPITDKKTSGEIAVKKMSDTEEALIPEKIKSVIKTGASTTDILESVLSGGLAMGVSDIHFEPERDKVKVRFRVDGVLKEIVSIPSVDYKYVVSRLKLIGEMKMNITDMAQDGRLTIVADGDRIEVRISLNPSEYGETAVLRILDPKNISLELKDLGLRPDDEAIVRRNLKKPNGMVLVTGPTGSGKTTALYAFLKSIRSPEVKIITIEDPIEYHLDGIQQTQVDPSAGYDFSSGLRSLLRQDPDAILVGEIRDLDTAEIAIHASLTGHLVFSTLHTNSASGAIPRLIDVGVKPQVIGPALDMVIAERLVRRLCEKCKRPIDPDPETAGKLKSFIDSLPPKVDKSAYEDTKQFEPVGCPICMTGTKAE